MAWFWLSFADAERAPGTQFLGVVIINADDPASAVRLAHIYGINPGGDVHIQMLSDEHVQRVIPEPMRKRLLTKEEALSIGGGPM